MVPGKFKLGPKTLQPCSPATRCSRPNSGRPTSVLYLTVFRVSWHASAINVPQLSYLKLIMSIKCVAGALCAHAQPYFKTLKKGKKEYLQGRNIPQDLQIKCAHEFCNKYACCDSSVCLAALQHHYNLEHVRHPLLDLTAEQIHSLAYSLTYHFALDYNLSEARLNHAIVSSLPDGVDCSKPGYSDRYNSHCSTCGVVLGAFAFEEDAGLVCFPCAKATDSAAAPSNAEGTNTIRLCSKQ